MGGGDIFPDLKLTRSNTISVKKCMITDRESELYGVISIRTRLLQIILIKKKKTI